MIRKVRHYMPSPLQRGQGVLTLECGHLHGFQTGETDLSPEVYNVWNPKDKPAEVDCPHYPCDPSAPDYSKHDFFSLDNA